MNMGLRNYRSIVALVVAVVLIFICFNVRSRPKHHPLVVEDTLMHSYNKLPIGKSRVVYVSLFFDIKETHGTISSKDPLIGILLISSLICTWILTWLCFWMNQ